MLSLTQRLSSYERCLWNFVPAMCSKFKELEWKLLPPTFFLLQHCPIDIQDHFEPPPTKSRAIQHAKLSKEHCAQPIRSDLILCSVTQARGLVQKEGAGSHILAL